jgi:hypothetical protein
MYRPNLRSDGGMGGRGAQLSMDVPLEPGTSRTNAGGAESARPRAQHGGPPHLQNLASEVGEKSAMLRSQLRGLDLLSTAFGQLIEEVGGSKGDLARLLSRVRDNYRLLFSNLIDNILEINSQYHASLKGCVNDYKNLQLPRSRSNTSWRRHSARFMELRYCCMDIA